MKMLNYYDFCLLILFIHEEVINNKHFVICMYAIHKTLIPYEELKNTAYLIDTFLIMIFIHICWGFVLTVVSAQFQDGFNDSSSENVSDPSSYSFLFSRREVRNPATAKFIDSAKKKIVPIMYEAEFWYDINKLKAKKKVVNFDKLCIQGVWLVYDNTDFQAKNKMEVGVISGEDTCVELKNYGKVESIQSITAISTRQANSLAFFPERNFNGPVFSLGVNHSDGPLGDIPKSSSLIIIGSLEWTMYPAVGDPICISPQGGKALRLPICFVSKLIDGKNIKTGSFLRIEVGCANTLKKVNIHFCMDYNTGKLQRITDVAHAIQGRGADEDENDDSGTTKASFPLKSSTNEVKKDKNGCPIPLTDQIDKEGKALLDIRLSVNLMSEENFLWPNAIGDIWKLELLERVFSIAFATCPTDLIPTEYLQLVREMFVYLWDTKGDKKAGNQTFTDFEWRELNFKLGECYEAVSMDADVNVEDDMYDAYTAMMSPEEAVGMLDPIYYLNPTYDPVIEMVWVTANHVVSTCHHAMNFPVDFWPNFINIFQEMYLKRVDKQWVTPGKLVNAYKYIFGGYGMANMHNKMALCATFSNLQVDNLDSFGRWVDSVKILGQ